MEAEASTGSDFTPPSLTDFATRTPPLHLWHLPHRAFFPGIITPQHDQSSAQAVSPPLLDGLALIFHPPLRFPPLQWWQLPQRDLAAGTSLPQLHVQSPLSWGSSARAFLALELERGGLFLLA